MISDGREQHARRAGAFFGRSAELASLGAAFEDVLGAHPVSVLLAGDAGIGKSRLLEEFLDIARLREAIVAVGMCVPGDDPCRTPRSSASCETLRLSLRRPLTWLTSPVAEYRTSRQTPPTACSQR